MATALTLQPSGIDRGSAIGTAVSVCDEFGQEVSIVDPQIRASISKQSWIPFYHGSKELPFSRQVQLGTPEKSPPAAEAPAVAADPALLAQVNDPALLARANGVLTRAFSPRQSLALEMAKGAKEYSGMFAELQRLRDDKIQKLKDDLPKIYGDLSSSMRYQKWLDLICGFVSGGAQIGSTMTTEKTLFHGIMKGLGEGGAVRGIQSFFDAGCQADQTGMQGKKSEKESQREGIIQGGNSADQAFQSFIQMIKDIHQTEQAMKAN